MESTNQKLSRAKLARLYGFLKPYLLAELGIVLIMVLVIALALIDPLVLKLLLDEVLVKGEKGLLNTIMIALVGLLVLRGGLNILTNYLYVSVGQRILFDIRFSLFRHLEKLHLGFFSQTKTGEILSRVNSDVDNLQSVVSTTFIVLITDLIMILAILGIILYMDWKLTLLSLIVVPFFLISQVNLGNKIKAKSRESREKSADILSFFEETFSGIRLVQSFVKEQFEARRLVKKSRHLIKVRISLGVLGAVTSSIAAFLMALGPFTVLWYGGYKVMDGSLTIGSLVAFYAYVGRMFGPIYRLAQHNVDLQMAMASMDRIVEYLDIEPSIKDSPGGLALERAEGEIVFDHVSFSYDHDDLVLEDISFEVKPGQCVAIVGRSGAGKSTIVNLLCRFYDPRSGAIRLDGYDIRDIKLASLRRHCGLVSQDTILFNTSIKENIRYGNTKASDAQTIDAARKAHIHDFIMSLPDKYDTIVGDRGVRLSGGECQRLSIARTILKDPRVLIMDEAMSSLDSKTERLIQASLESLLQNRTSIIIAHRLSTIANADNILVLGKGNIVECGTHHDLLGRNGEYRMLWEEMAHKRERAVN